MLHSQSQKTCHRIDNLQGVVAWTGLYENELLESRVLLRRNILTCVAFIFKHIRMPAVYGVQGGFCGRFIRAALIEVRCILSRGLHEHATLLRVAIINIEVQTYRMGTFP